MTMGNTQQSSQEEQMDTSPSTEAPMEYSTSRTSTLPRKWHPVSTRWRDKLEKLVNIADCEVVNCRGFVIGKNDEFLIGTGNNGTEVFLGLTDDGTEVAVKKMTKRNWAFLENEWTLLCLPKLDHPSIMQYVDIDLDKNFCYLALQLCEYTMEEYIKQRKPSEVEKKRLAREVLIGLSILHSQENPHILHRDIKPQNVLIDIQGKARLSDFGNSRALVDGKSTRYTSPAGTKCWMAKETLVDQPSVHYRRSTDIQVAGMLIYYILSEGHHPFGDDFTCQGNIYDGNYDLVHVQDVDAKHLIEWMIHADPKKRPTVEECLFHRFWSNERSVDHRAESPAASCGSMKSDWSKGEPGPSHTEKDPVDLNIVLLGNTGVGKSASGNTILGEKAFVSKLSFRSVTTEIKSKTKNTFGRQISVFDTPGIFRHEQKDIKTLCEKVLLSSIPCLFLVVVKISRFTEEDHKAVKKVMEILGPAGLKKSYMLFTKGDALDEASVTDFIFEAGRLPVVVFGSFGGRYHVFNNEDGGQDQVEELLKKFFPLTTNSCQLSLDENTASNDLELSEENKKVSLTVRDQGRPKHKERFTPHPQVLSRESLPERSYFEVEWSERVHIAVSYKDISREDSSLFGLNKKSWALWCTGSSYRFYHNSIKTVLSGRPSTVGGLLGGVVGVYSDLTTGCVSFYKVDKNTQTLLHTEKTTFTQPLYAGIWTNGTAEVCKI